MLQHEIHAMTERQRSKSIRLIWSKCQGKKSTTGWGCLNYHFRWVFGPNAKVLSSYQSIFGQRVGTRRDSGVLEF